MLTQINTPVASSVSSSTAVPRPARGDGQQVATVQKVQEEVTSNPVPQGHHAQVTEAVDAINAHLQRVSRNLQFSVDQDSGRVVVKVVDGETDTVIRQMPSEEALAISHALDKLQGLIIEHKA